MNLPPIPGGGVRRSKVEDGSPNESTTYVDIGPRRAIGALISRGDALYVRLFDHPRAPPVLPWPAPAGEAVATLQSASHLSENRPPRPFSRRPPMKFLSFVVSLIVILHAWAARAQNDEEGLKKRFLEEYPKALKAWEEKFFNAEGRVELTGHGKRRNAEVTSHIIYSFKCKLPNMAVLDSVIDSDGPATRSVQGYNRDYSFNLKKSSEAADFFVQSLKPANGEGRVARSSPLWNFLWFPYACVFPNIHMISSPRFVVKAVSPLVRNGKSLLRIEFDDPWPHDPNASIPKNLTDVGGYDGYFVASPEEMWVLYEFECRQKKGASRPLYKGTVDYEGTVDGFPIPRHVTRRTFKLPEGDLVGEYSYEFKYFRFSDHPESEFRLAAFGIPERVSKP